MANGLKSQKITSFSRKNMSVDPKNKAKFLLADYRNLHKLALVFLSNVHIPIVFLSLRKFTICTDYTEIEH